MDGGIVAGCASLQTDRTHPIPLIELSQVTKTYRTGGGEVLALQGIDLIIAQGEMVVLSGKSGCGKTTLLNLIGALDRPSAGEIRVGGVVISSLSERERTLFRRRRVGTIFQSFNLIPMLTVEENIALPRWLDGHSPEETAPLVRELLARTEMAHRRSHRAHELSGGEQQRVAIARALINSPQVILADEPTGNLDSQTGGQVLRLLQELNRERKQTILIATHSREADPLAHRILFMKDGRIVAEERQKGGS